MQFRFSSDVAILPRVAPPLPGSPPRKPVRRQAFLRAGPWRALCTASRVARGESIWNLFDVGASLQRFADVLPL
jgi:hypothetical protein